MIATILVWAALLIGGAVLAVVVGIFGWLALMLAISAVSPYVVGAWNLCKSAYNGTWNLIWWSLGRKKGLSVAERFAAMEKDYRDRLSDQALCVGKIFQQMEDKLLPRSEHELAMDAADKHLAAEGARIAELERKVEWLIQQTGKTIAGVPATVPAEAPAEAAPAKVTVKKKTKARLPKLVVAPPTNPQPEVDYSDALANMEYDEEENAAIEQQILQQAEQSANAAVTTTVVPDNFVQDIVAELGSTPKSVHASKADQQPARPERPRKRRPIVAR